MKKVIISCAVIALALIIGTGFAYAWYSNIYRATFSGIELTPTEVIETSAGVNSSVTGTFSGTVNLGQSKTIAPATSTDGNTFKTKAGETSTQFVAVNGYIKVPNDTQTFRVSEITLSGTDEINKAVRVAVTFNGERKVYAPVQGADGNIQICSPLGENFSTGLEANTPTLVNIIVWYEGTDSSVTASNAHSANGTNISLLVEAE